jgi:hypothetical protein
LTSPPQRRGGEVKKQTRREVGTEGGEKKKKGRKEVEKRRKYDEK